MLSTIKNWFVRMWIPDVEPNEDDEKLNPLGWGTLFFSVWVSLKVLKELNPKMKVTLFQIVLEWALLAVSVILLFAIYIVPWRDILKKFTQKYYAFPIVFIITVFSFILGWVPGLGLTGMNQWLAAGIGFLWFITPIMIIIARFKRLLTRGLICIVFLIYTSYVERQNLTMRMSMRRFTRLTNGFSKKVENLEYAVALHFMQYNFARPHKTLANPYPRTPSMAAGISTHIGTIEDIVRLVNE